MTALALLVGASTLAGCTGTGTPSPSASSPASGRVTEQGAPVTTTSADVAGFALSQHVQDNRYHSPDRTSVASDATPPGFAAPPPGQGRQRYLDQKVHWKGCGVFECATVLVPLDWDRPDGQAITLAMRRAKASSGTSKGTLFINPGGPGASGQDMVTSFDGGDVPDHDVIGWDPRGSGASTPVRCGTPAQTTAYLDVDSSPDDAAEWAAEEAANKAFAAQCRQASGALLDHVSTIDDVRDLDYLRYLVGDAKLDYLGVSYGTFIGATYAELYPQRVGRMVLDSAVNITDDESVIQPMGFDLAMKNYADWCARTSCGLGTSQAAVVDRITGLLKGLDSKPLGVGNRTLTQSLGVTGTVAYLYWGAEAYDQFTQVLTDALAGKGDGLMQTADLFNGRDKDGSYGSMTYAFPAISCADAADPGEAGLRPELARAVKLAPITAPFFGPGMTCTWWSAKPGPQLKLVGKGAAPIVVLGATGDPATPYQQARWMADQLESGVLVTWKGAGHSAYELGNDCVKDAVRGYLNKGTVPAKGTTC